MLNETESCLVSDCQSHIEFQGDTCMQGILPPDATETSPGLHDFVGDENGVVTGVSGGLDKDESEEPQSDPAKGLERRRVESNSLMLGC